MSILRNPARPLAIALALTGLAVVVTGCRVSFGDNDAGPPVTESYDIEPFTELQVGGAWDVSIEVGPETSLEVEVAEDLLDDVVVDSSGGRLTIDLDQSGFFSNTGSHKATITTPDLTVLKLDGAVDTDVDGLETDQLEATLNGAVDLDLGTMNAQELNLKLDGAPTVVGSGSVSRLTIDADGAVSVEFDRVDVNEAEVDADGAVSLELGGARSITGELSGASSLQASESATVDVRTSGAASIDR